ncbi:LIM domain kinase 1-like [Nematostella vectensis]|uniref:LIM domain kinase 1-like n=1 Tax=Nematostella vectensis TaxID=45351 RepID=UPI002076F1C6|nr:LIM domain kinase 1-like [Nematostella vectensis]
MQDFPSSINYCATCGEPCIKTEYKYAIGKRFHNACFRCVVCEERLSTDFYARGSELYCKKDYLSKFNSVCHICAHNIAGLVMVIGDHKFHTECFHCQHCDSFLAVDDNYVMVERHRLLCGNCYNKETEALESTQNVSTYHSIHHLQLRQDDTKKRKIFVNVESSEKKQTGGKRRNSIVIIKEFSLGRDSQQRDSLLEAGDKVLELNNMEVTDETVDQVGAALTSKPDEEYNITFERNTLPRSNLTRTKDNPVLSSTSTFKFPATKIEIPPTTSTASSTSSSATSTSSLSLKATSTCLVESKPPLTKQKSLDLDSRQSKKEEDEKAIQRAKSVSYFSKRAYKRTMTNQSSVDDSGLQVSCKNGDLCEEYNGNAVVRTASMPRSNCTSGLPKPKSPLFRAQSFRNNLNSRVFLPKDLIVGEVIGRGFFGQVMKVTHKTTGEVMVLKELINYDDEAKAGFLKEVALLKSLQHPNVLHFIGILYKGKTLNLIVEYIPGGTLQRVLKDKSRPLSWAQKVKISRDIAAGMAYLHEMNVMHRDLNSNNCLVHNDEEMTVVVADFGLARLHQEEPLSHAMYMSGQPSANLTTATDGGKPPLSPGRPPAPKKRYTVVGTPYWMAPEMFNGRDYDHRVDIFAFCIVACEIIGRVEADPDYLPRKKDFTVDEDSFRMKFCAGCPAVFYKLAFLCGHLDPDKRPPFETVREWLDAIYLHLEVGLPLPDEIEFSLMPRSLMKTIKECAETDV